MGAVSVGLAPPACSVRGLPPLPEVRDHDPYMRLQFVESLSGRLATMPNARQLDLAVLYRSPAARRSSAAVCRRGTCRVQLKLCCGKRS